MKKLLAILIILLMCSPVFAESRIYNLYLGTTNSGNTTQASGTSTLVVEGGGFNRSNARTVINGINEFEGYFNMQVQLAQVVTSYAANSGATFTVRWQESDVNNPNAWTAASYYDVPGLTGVALSGNSKVICTFNTVSRPQFMRFSFLSGITLFENFQVQLKID